jgi:hypothetical protein
MKAISRQPEPPGTARAADEVPANLRPMLIAERFGSFVWSRKEESNCSGLDLGRKPVDDLVTQPGRSAQLVRQPGRC